MTYYMYLSSELMKAEGLTKSYANVNTFLDKPFLPMKNFKRKNAEQKIYPPLLYYKWHNSKAWKEVLYPHELHEFNLI